MADADIFPPLQPAEFRAWRKRTKDERTQRLGAGHDARGKARVVFALPEQDWRRETV